MKSPFYLVRAGVMILVLLSSSLYCQCKHAYNTYHLYPNTQASNLRSDTIDILNYNINLDITDFTTNTIQGFTDITYTPKMNGVNTLSFDLLKLTVDSVEIGGNNLSYNYNDTLLIATLSSTHNIGDTNTIRVYYRGAPIKDPTWGGFYYNSGYAFNMGVGFDAEPHNYGRVWFPCFDNFVEKSTYDFTITTNNGKVAYCNGLLTKDTTYGSGDRVRSWSLSQQIPTYLANVAISNYTDVNYNYLGIQDTIPVMLTALPADTTNFKNSFANLDSALRIFETHYGPYLWDKVGYYLVPFNAGAMEHSTSISYPKYAANGTLAYESLMSHELAHQWFGDLVTCETAEDMWINEGMASFSAHLFTEGLYGTTAYKNEVRENHEWVLHYAHIRENGYRAVAGIPHNLTYGDHVYKKGASVAHTLRGYLGDSLFFLGLQSVLANNKYGNLNSTQFINQIATATSTNLSDFLNDWILSPGFSHFSIDSFVVTPTGPDFNVDIHVKQKLTGTSTLHDNIPLEVSFYDINWNKEIRQITMTGGSFSIQFKLPINPVYVGVNLDEKVNDATAQEMKVIKTTGTANFDHARMEVIVNAIGDSVLLKIDHNYTAPDPFKVQQGYRLSPNRYWKVDGIIPNGFKAGAKVYYDGRSTFSNSNGYLDHDLITASEDSLVLLYRASSGDDWAVFPHYNVTTGFDKLDKYGLVTLDSLFKGEYTFAMKDFTASSTNLHESAAISLHVFPNPSQGDITLTLDTKVDSNFYIKMLDMHGRIVYEKNNVMNREVVPCNNFSSGIYFIRVYHEGYSIASKKVILNKN